MKEKNNPDRENVSIFKTHTIANKNLEQSGTIQNLIDISYLCTVMTLTY